VSRGIWIIVAWNLVIVIKGQSLFMTLARLEGFEPTTYGLEGNTSELPNLLKVKEVSEIT
jgi:hypothetical protein